MILNREDGDDTCPIKIHDKKICLQVTFWMFIQKVPIIFDYNYLEYLLFKI